MAEHAPTAAALEGAMTPVANNSTNPATGRKQARKKALPRPMIYVIMGNVNWAAIWAMPATPV